MIKRYSRRDQTAPLVLTKNTNSAKTFKKVAGKNKWHYSCYIVTLILCAWYYCVNPLGFSGGAYALVAPYYVSEVAEVSLRGALASVQQLMATLGVLFVNALNINEAVDWSTISG